MRSLSDAVGVVQDSSHLLQVRRAQEEIDVVKRLRGQQRECLRLDAQHVMSFPGFHRDVLFRQQSVLGIVRSKFKQFLVVERNGCMACTSATRRDCSPSVAREVWYFPRYASGYGRSSVLSTTCHLQNERLKQTIANRRVFVAGRLSAGGCLSEHVRRDNPLWRTGMERTQRVAECSDHDDFHLISAGLDPLSSRHIPKVASRCTRPAGRSRVPWPHCRTSRSTRRESTTSRAPERQSPRDRPHRRRRTDVPEHSIPVLGPFATRFPARCAKPRSDPRRQKFPNT